VSEPFSWNIFFSWPKFLVVDWEMFDSLVQLSDSPDVAHNWFRIKQIGQFRTEPEAEMNEMLVVMQLDKFKYSLHHGSRGGEECAFSRADFRWESVELFKWRTRRWILLDGEIAQLEQLCERGKCLDPFSCD
jgi:hypothetical protein